MEYRVLGSLEVLGENGQRLPLRGARQQSVLASLLLRAGQTVALERLVDEVWEEPPETAAKTVQVYVSRLRHALPTGAIESRRGGYALLLDGDRLDLRAFEHAADLGRTELAAGHCERAADLLRQALAFWRGPPLAGLASEALRREAERLEELRLQALEDRFEADLGRGRAREVVAELKPLVAEQPFRERPRAQLMLALYRAGRPTDALSLYRETRRLLVEELGTEPGQELRELEQAILRGDPALEAPSEPRSNLPEQPTPLIGRARELGEVIDLLRANRLLTLTGPGGVGKTRLALQAASEVVHEFRDGVWFVDFAALRDPDLVLPTIAQTLGAKEPQTVEEHLREKRVLLVLDNLEQLLEAALSLTALLRDSPGAKLLVTSRARLHLSGEQEYPVPPLTDEAAVQLFVDRARGTDPAFETDEHIREICRRLDNLPLALELAAARTKILSPQALLARLGERLPVLTGGPLDAPERQRTLRAAIEWSHDLLTPEEQGLFARLAVFAGSFALQAAEEVAAAGLDALQSLVEKSLLRDAGEDRFSMLETVREYALERFAEAGMADDVQSRHAEHYARLAREIDARIRSPEQYLLLQQLELEDGNTRAALGWLLEADPVSALELALHLEAFWAQRDRLRESIHWLEEAVQRVGETEPALRAHGLREAGEAERILGNEQEATALFRESLALAEQAGEKREVAGALLRLGGQAVESLALYRELGDEDGAAQALVLLGEEVSERGDLVRARELVEESVQILRRLGSPWTLAGALHSLGDCALLEGGLDEARECYRESLRIGLDLNTEYLVVYCLAGLAAVAAKTGTSESAIRLWGAVQGLENSRGYRVMQPHRARYERLLDQLVEAPELAAALREGFEGGTDAAVELAFSLSD